MDPGNRASSVLICIFVLGIGLAFSSPVWGAIVPDLVTKDELPSAITLGGVQLNLSGIVGPAIGGLLLPLLGAPLVISINALMFLVVALAVLQWKPGQAQLTGLRENFTESFISSLRYARNSPRMRTVLFRDLAFALVISIVPALLPVVALKEMHLSASQLGVVLSCVGIGSLAGAVFVLPYLRQRTSPNAITSISMAILVAVLFTLALLRELPVLMTCATLAGAAWALAGSELWVAGQRVMPGWVRGRMNAFQIMLGQGGMALGAASWGTGVAHAGLDLTFAAAAVVALAVLVMGYRFSINFGVDPSLDAAPRSPLHDFPEIPGHEEGPVTVTIEYSIAEEDRDRFRDLMQEVQATCRRNGAFHCRLDECLEHPGKFRLEFIVSTWAEHLRQNMRMTVDEARVFDTVWEMHAGDSEPMVRHYLATQKCVHLHGYGFCGRTFTDTSSLSRPKLESSTSSSRA